MPRYLRPLLFVWTLAHPILPIAPLIGALVAIAAGPPFVVGFDAAGWPVIGAVTPLFAAVSIGLPWAAGTLLILAAALQPDRRRRGDARARRPQRPETIAGA